MIRITSHCPDCLYTLVIIEEYKTVRIEDNGQVVLYCPNCLTELDVDNGQIVETKKGGVQE